MSVLIETSLGDITVDLYTEERPRSCLNFLKLCKIKYYNFCLFHSVQKNLVAQTGDPSGSGRGGVAVFTQLYGEQAAYFDMETVPRIKHTRKGLVSMVNNGKSGHGSQFFFTLGDDLDYLDGVHTVFGEVAEGFEILDKINEAYCDEEHRPYKDIRVYHTIILDDPYDDPNGLQIPDRSPEPTKEQLDSGRIGAEEDIDDTKGLTDEQIRESLAKKEAAANAQILEMVGDLPDADVKPPDTVLFVCKLNPVTTAEDLEIIFSRFGTIKSCEVIKDQKSEESLQYAFIEFEKPEDCESAYFKMDNVLIDDRRIHVDFSQSVSKLVQGEKGQPAVELGSKYTIKDQSRKDNRYDLVFEEESTPADSGPKEQEKNRKRRASRSRSPVSQKRRGRSKSPSDRGRQREDNSEGKRREENEGRQKHKKHKRNKSPDSEQDGSDRRKKKSPAPRLEDHGGGKKKKYADQSPDEESDDNRQPKSRRRSPVNPSNTDRDHRKTGRDQGGARNRQSKYSDQSQSDSEDDKRRNRKKENSDRKTKDRGKKNNYDNSDGEIDNRKTKDRKKHAKYDKSDSDTENTRSRKGEKKERGLRGKGRESSSEDDSDDQRNREKDKKGSRDKSRESSSDSDSANDRKKTSSRAKNSEKKSKYDQLDHDKDRTRYDNRKYREKTERDDRRGESDKRRERDKKRDRR